MELYLRNFRTGGSFYLRVTSLFKKNFTAKFEGLSTDVTLIQQFFWNFSGIYYINKNRYQKSQ